MSGLNETSAACCSNPPSLPLKGKRKRIVRDKEDSLRPSQNSPGSIGSCSSGVKRKFPNLAPKQRVDRDTPTSSHMLPVQPTYTSRQAIHPRVGAGLHNSVQDMDDPFGRRNFPAMTDALQHSEPQNLSTTVDPLLVNPDESQTGLSYAWDNLSLQSIPIAPIIQNPTMPTPQASATMYCQCCDTLLKSLRDNIIAITSSQVPQSCGVIAKLWKSFFDLHDHCKDNHGLVVRGLPA